MGAIGCHGNSIQFTYKTYATFLHPSDAAHKFLSWLANLPQRYSNLKVWTDDEKIKKKRRVLLANPANVVSQRLASVNPLLNHGGTSNTCQLMFIQKNLPPIVQCFYKLLGEIGVKRFSVRGILLNHFQTLTAKVFPGVFPQCQALIIYVFIYLVG